MLSLLKLNSGLPPICIGEEPNKEPLVNHFYLLFINAWAVVTGAWLVLILLPPGLITGIGSLVVLNIVWILISLVLRPYWYLVQAASTKGSMSFYGVFKK